MLRNVLWCDEGHEIPCPWCGGTDLAPHIHEEFAWVTISIQRCRACGHRFANPCPTPEAAAKHYNAGYLKQARTALPASLDDVFDPNSIWAAKMRHYAHFLSQLPPLPDDIRLIDDGCSWGGLMASAQKRFPGARCTGVDLAAPAVKFAEETFGVDGFVGTLADYVAAHPDARFDLVLSSHCLEHSLTLRDSIAAFAHVLAPGGRLALTMPNHDSFLRKQMGGFSPAIRGGNHYHFFGAEFLRGALEAYGITVERTFTSTEVSPYRETVLVRLKEAKDARAEAGDPLAAVDADGEGEFLYVMGRRG